MTLLTLDLRFVLRANAMCHEAAQRAGRAEPDPRPVMKFFNPCGAATWLATELLPDGDTLFGLAGCPDLGTFLLREIASIHLPFGLTIERDLDFKTPHPISVWTDAARAAGSILGAAHHLEGSSPYPPPTDPDPDGSGSVG